MAPRFLRHPFLREALLAHVPRPLRPLFRRLLYLPDDLARTLVPHDGPPVPPRGLMEVGLGDFLAVGRDFLGHFVRVGGLRPDARVLDVGCGIGRMAVPLAAYLGPEGSYVGFDVRRRDVRWCRRHLGRRQPDFTFVHLDVRNREYNPRGRTPPEAATFPVADTAIDFAIATSVFTHLLPAATDRYLAEIRRVLAPGGCLFATFFLLDPETEALPGFPAAPRFERFDERCRVQDPKNPEAAIAYETGLLLQTLTKHGLRLRGPIHRGQWAGRPDGLTYQDVVLIELDGG